MRSSNSSPEIEDGPACDQRGKPTMKEVAACFHLPIEVAAKKLGVGQTWLKLLCRSNGVSRWPYRKIQSLQNSLDRSKKMQSLVEVAKVINKNLPRWLDLSEEGSEANASPAGDQEQGEADRDSEDSHDENTDLQPQSSGRSASESEACSFVPPGFYERLSGTESHLRPQNKQPLSAQALFAHDLAPRHHQWEQILQSAVARQAVETTKAASPPTIGNGAGSAFKPVAKQLLRPEPRMPPPIDFTTFFRRPSPFQIMPLYQEHLLKAPYGSPLACQTSMPQSYLMPSSGLEHLIASATAKSSGSFH
eukprot:scaffold172066_cov44-Prasinocladus_malaysianus.AAC.1